MVLPTRRIIRSDSDVEIQDGIHVLVVVSMFLCV